MEEGPDGVFNVLGKIQTENATAKKDVLLAILKAGGNTATSDHVGFTVDDLVELATVARANRAHLSISKTTRDVEDLVKIATAGKKFVMISFD